MTDPPPVANVSFGVIPNIHITQHTFTQYCESATGGI